MVMNFTKTAKYLDLIGQLSNYTNTSTDIVTGLESYSIDIYKSDLENEYAEPMVVIGGYIVFASLCCIIAMGFDLVHGLRSKKPWPLPIKYFPLNAVTLTGIAVAMKLPMDLSGSMPGNVDQLAKLASMAFMCTMMGNFLPSLATMNNTELLTNVIGLGVLVITLVVNICIQIDTGVVGRIPDEQAIAAIRSDYSPGDLQTFEQLTYTIMATIYVTMLLMLLIIHVSSSLAILNSKEIIELKYQVHEKALKEELQSTTKLLTVEKLQQHVSKFWIMAGSGSPLFIAACSATTIASGVLKVDKYWTQKLQDWKYGSISLPLISISLPFGNYKSKVRIRTLKNRVLNFCIILQCVVVVVCKIIALIPFFLTTCLHCLNWLFRTVFSSGRVSNDYMEQFHYVLQHENANKLSKGTMKRLLKSLNQLIQKSKKKEPKSLMNLIKENPNKNFQGVKGFDKDDHQVQCSPLKDCWSVIVVTLTTIAVTLPNIDKVKLSSLLKSVREGLQYVTLVEETLNVTDDYKKSQKAAKILWEEVDFNHKWLGIKLKDMAPQVNKTTSQVDAALQVVKSFLMEANNIKKGVGSPNICALSMSHVTETIISDKESHKKLFDELSSRITDIMAACLTNLPLAIAMKCHTTEIEKMEESVEVAAKLLGETKEIISILQKDYHIPDMNTLNDLPVIDRWRAYLREP
ncbi:hypothetical protein Hdeb2414_s0025g00669891 [Helianthus debilis subsp. tardiflorus]